MSHFSFSDANRSKEILSGQILNDVSQEQVGYYEMFVSGNRFTAAINISPKYQNLGLGFQAFKRCFDTLNETNELKYFHASWTKDPEYSHLPKGSSVNLTVFNQLVDNGMAHYDALWKTPTGKWLNKLGFTHVTIKEYNSESLTAIYSKQDSLH